jgi:hypothetical protein
MKYAKYLLICIGLLIIALVPACSAKLTGMPFLSSNLNNAQRLVQVLPTLEEFRVTQFRNDDWCQNLFYARGKFSSVPNNDICNLSQDETRPLTSQSEQDFRAVERVLIDSGLKVRLVVVGFDARGQVRYAEFHLDCYFCRTRYVYDPGYDRLPEDIPGELQHEAINSDWYLVRDDWN